MEYTGYRVINGLDIESLSKLYTAGLNTLDNMPESLLDMLNNEYLVVDQGDIEPLYFCYQDNKFRQVKYPTISNDYNDNLKPRNLQLLIAMDMLKDRKTPVKLLRGVYGSGKDLLMLNQALSLLESGDFEKIVFVRPNIGVANIPDIGYLPGSIEEKLNWTLAPFYDKVGGESGIQLLIREDKLEMVPLSFIRGRSFENSIVYVCEGLNSTPEIMKLLLSRVGDNSEIWINGDCHQTDKRIFDKDNGITKLIDKLKDNKLFGYVYLPITERSEVARLADLLD